MFSNYSLLIGNFACWNIIRSVLIISATRPICAISTIRDVACWMSTCSRVASIISSLPESKLILRRYLVHLNLIFLSRRIYVVDLLSSTITTSFRSHDSIFSLYIRFDFIYIFITLNIQCLYYNLACVPKWCWWTVYF